MIDLNQSLGIESYRLLVKSGWWRRFDLVPFIGLDVVLVGVFLQSWWVSDEIKDHWENWRWIGSGIGLGACLVLHFGVFLLCFWSPESCAYFRYEKAKSVSRADFVLVIPRKHHGSPKIVPLERNGVQGSKSDKRFTFDATIHETHFFFNGEKYYVSNDEKVSRLDYPVDLALSEYLKWTGYSSTAPSEPYQKWGKNVMPIPSSNLSELFLENALSPFFIFQVFCVGLWCLDEYWYYSIFTLVMLVVFELLLSKQRLVNVENIRRMRRPPIPVLVFRGGVWGRLISSELVPGDIVSVLRLKTNGSSVEDRLLMPCDVLLLHGSCIVNEAMLSGESAPKVKVSVNSAATGSPAILKSKLDFLSTEAAQHVILGGTEIVQHVSPNLNAASGSMVSMPPDGGCPCFVLRTGFATSQGSLLRTILYSANRVTVENTESYLFILALLGFAIVAATYVLSEGLKNESNSRWKLILHCIMIVTSVVPPELPMELSLAVNTSLGRLHKLSIYCTEPHRIPLAGKLDVCCFDKTGTLTSDVYAVKGVLCPNELDDPLQLTPAAELNFESTAVIAGCHSLMRLNDKVDGDSMEKACMRAVGWGITREGHMVERSRHDDRVKKNQLRIASRHQFSSELKRSSVVAFVDEIYSKTKQDRKQNTTGLIVLCKGAPEAIQPLLASIPEKYELAYQSLMMQGFRVLCLAFKRLPLDMSEKKIRAIPREQVESKLNFAGFLVLQSPLKCDTLEVLSQIRYSGHRTVVITGDSVLTTCGVARKGGIFDNLNDKVLELRAQPLSDEIVWQSVDPLAALPNKLVFSPESVETVSKAGYQLVVTGASMGALEKKLSPEEYSAAMMVLVNYVVIFARVSPRDKEFILATFRGSGLVSMMCGDGTNDVGALKQAHVGVSIVNSPDHEAALTSAQKHLKKRIPELTLKSMSPLEKLRVELQEMEKSAEGNSIVQLGDASIASPFTSRGTSILATAHIIRAGRCTLVTTIQMYKILALNCLVSAYSLSALHLYGVKQGDTQATLGGVLIAGLFMLIAWAEPLNELHDRKPVSTIFSLSVGISLLGQLLVHFCSLFLVLNFTSPFVDEKAEEMMVDADFKPNVINSAVFLLGLNMQCNVFGANYRGYPFMQSLKDNKPFYRLLLVTWSLSVILSLNLWPEIGEIFELVPIPNVDNYHAKFAAILTFDTVFSYSWEHMCRKFLGS